MNETDQFTTCYVDERTKIDLELAASWIRTGDVLIVLFGAGFSQDSRLETFEQLEESRTKKQLISYEQVCKYNFLFFVSERDNREVDYFCTFF
jgi:hypothetical protein